MSDLIIVLLSLWTFTSIIWLLSLYDRIFDKRTEFYNYVSHHQKFISLYVEVARQNREVLQQNQKYKHAVADDIFHKNGFTLVECTDWYKKHNIDPASTDEKSSSVMEVAHFIKLDDHDTRYSKTILS